MLAYRNDESTIQTNLAIKNNGEQLRVMAEQSMETNESMTHLTTDIHTDSKFVKVLTFIAVLYTPASLVAVGYLCSKLAWNRG